MILQAEILHPAASRTDNASAKVPMLTIFSSVTLNLARMLVQKTYVSFHSQISLQLNMLPYAVIFFVIALVAGVFGFGGIAATAVGTAKILCFVFVSMAIVIFLVSMMRRN